MKFNKSILIFLGAIFFVTILFTGCLHQWNKIPDNCFDGIRNNGEEKVDCGGPCITCNPCENGLWDYQLGETWVDCGGDCCECPPHANGCQDAGESGIDCGGTSGIDCESLCNDGLVNGWEDGAINPITEQPYECGESPVDIFDIIPDCGGSCDPCPSCNDIILNQGEQWIDCGGPCDGCVGSGSCINGIQDGFEIDIDCGALPPTQGYCPTCPIILECEIGGVSYDFALVLEVLQTEYLPWTSATGDKKTVKFTGFSTTGLYTIQGQIAEPELLGWIETSSSISMFCDAESWDDTNVNSENGSSYLTITDPENAGGPYTTKELIQPGFGITYDNFTKLNMASSGYIWGNFSGNLKDDFGAGIAVTNGNFKLIMEWDYP